MRRARVCLACACADLESIGLPRSLWEEEPKAEAPVVDEPMAAVEEAPDAPADAQADDKASQPTRQKLNDAEHAPPPPSSTSVSEEEVVNTGYDASEMCHLCLLYTSPSPRDS